MLAALARRERLPPRLALVVAHPDDEVLAAGASLFLMPELLLVHATDGAPRRLDDAARLGFTTPEAYAEAREAELRAALRLAGVDPLRERLGVPDQDAALHMAAMTERLAALFAGHGTAAVLTHAYEGGHPDHDATAFAVHRAAARLGLPVWEFPAYRAGPHGMLPQSFLPGPPETAVSLSPAEAEGKRALLACFRSQAAVLAAFDPATERFRPAPAHDFARPPHPGRLNYESWGWEMTGASWCRLAVAAGVPCAA